MSDRQDNKGNDPRLEPIERRLTDLEDGTRSVTDALASARAGNNETAGRVARIEQSLHAVAGALAELSPEPKPPSATAPPPKRRPREAFAAIFFPSLVFVAVLCLFVSSMNGAGYSGGEPPVNASGAVADNTPSNVFAAAEDDKTVRITWIDESAAGVDAEKFEIARKERGKWQSLATVTGDIRTYSDASVKEGKVYEYSVRAWYGKECSEYSKSTSVYSTKPGRQLLLVNRVHPRASVMYTGELDRSDAVKFALDQLKEMVNYLLLVAGAVVATFLKFTIEPLIGKDRRSFAIPWGILALLNTAVLLSILSLIFGFTSHSYLWHLATADVFALGGYIQVCYNFQILALVFSVLLMTIVGAIVLVDHVRSGRSELAA